MWFIQFTMMHPNTYQHTSWIKCIFYTKYISYQHLSWDWIQQKQNFVRLGTVQTENEWSRCRNVSTRLNKDYGNLLSLPIHNELKTNSCHTFAITVCFKLKYLLFLTGLRKTEKNLINANLSFFVKIRNISPNFISWINYCSHCKVVLFMPNLFLICVYRI